MDEYTAPENSSNNLPVPAIPPSLEPLLADRRRRKRGRGCTGCLIVFGILILIVLFLLAVVPQMAVESFIQNMTGGMVTLKSTRISPVRLGIGEMRIYPDAAAKTANEPLFALDKLQIRLAPFSERKVTLFELDKLDLHLDIKSMDNTNFTFITEKNTSRDNTTPYPSSPTLVTPSRPLPPPFMNRTDLTFVPRTLLLKNLGFSAEWPGWTAGLKGLALTGSFDTPETFSLTASQAPEFSVWLRPEGPGDAELQNGELSFLINRTDDQMEGNIAFNAPGLAEVFMKGDMRIDRTGKIELLNWDCRKLLINGALLSKVAEASPFTPVRFETVGITGAAVRFDMRDGTPRFKPSHLEFQAKGLSIGGDHRHIYEGDLTAEVSAATREDITNAEINAVFNRGQKLAASARIAGESETRARAEIAAWSREDARALVPEELQNTFDNLATLKTLSAVADVYWTAPKYHAMASATAALEYAPMNVKDTLHVTVDAIGTWTDGAISSEAMVGLALEDKGAIAATLRADPGKEPDILLQLDKVDPLKWFEATSGMSHAELRAMAGTKVSGHVKPGRSADGTAQTFALDLTLSPLSYPPVVLTDDRPVQLKGEIVAAPEDTTGTLMELTQGENLRLAVSNWKITANSFDAEAQWEASALLAPWIGRGISGDITAKGSLRNESGVMRIPAEMTSPSLAWWKLRATPEHPASLSMTTCYDSLAKQIWGESLRVTLAPESYIECAKWSRNPATGVIEAPELRASANLAELAMAGLFQSAAGAARAYGSFSRTPGGEMLLSLAPDIAAETFVLPENWAAGQGMTFSGECSWSSEKMMGGTGNLTAARLMSCGFALTNVKAAPVFNGERIEVTDATAAFCGGTMRATIQADVLRDDMPIALGASFDAIDLARFTDEFKLEKAKLTGIADGDITIQYARPGGLWDAQVRLKSRGAMTINRDLLSQMLMSQYVKGFAGAEALQRMVSDVMGEDVQRAFDEVTLDLKMENGRLAGRALMRSEQLRLTMALTIDPQTITNLLRIRQESSMKDFAGITTNAADPAPPAQPAP